MEMEHELFHSKFKHLVERSSLLDIIEDSPSGENPHRAAAMELIFDKAIDDCRERVFARVDKSPPADSTVQPNSSGKETPLLSAAAQPTGVKPSAANKKSKPTTVQSVQTQDSPNVKPSQPSRIQPEVKGVFGISAELTTSRNASNVRDRAVPANPKIPAPAPRGVLPRSERVVWGP